MPHKNSQQCRCFLRLGGMGPPAIIPKFLRSFFMPLGIGLIY